MMASLRCPSDARPPPVYRFPDLTKVLLMSFIAIAPPSGGGAVTAHDAGSVENDGFYPDIVLQVLKIV